MNPSPRVHRSHWVTWTVFIALLVFAILFVTGTASELPPMVASHFDAGGQPNTFMTRNGYIRFVLCLCVGLPLLIVTVLVAVYSRATTLKLPNRDYWMAPERINRTRSFLAAHAVWFGSLLVVLTCSVHWLELGANRQQPPHLSSQAFAVCMIVFLVAMAAWIAVLMFAFRRPAKE
jgi:uncharacterized membrane protein